MSNGGPDFRLRSCHMDPSGTIQADDLIAVQGDVENVGDDSGRAHAAILVDGTEVTTADAWVQAGRSSNIGGVFVPASHGFDAGSHTVEIQLQADSQQLGLSRI